MLVIFAGEVELTWKVIPLWPLLLIKGGLVIIVPCPTENSHVQDKVRNSSNFLIVSLIDLRPLNYYFY
tara:strand:+ start:1964 stop:2167 length:204 start_codon:yes stop_codon:yes gene_type:complete